MTQAEKMQFIPLSLPLSDGLYTLQDLFWKDAPLLFWKSEETESQKHTGEAQIDGLSSCAHSWGKPTWITILRSASQLSDADAALLEATPGLTSHHLFLPQIAGDAKMAQQASCLQEVDSLMTKTGM